MGSVFQERIAAGEAVIESRNGAKPGARISLLPLFFVQTDLFRQPGGPGGKVLNRCRPITADHFILVPFRSDLSAVTLWFIPC